MLENEKNTTEIKSVGEILRLARENADIAISKVVEDLRIKQLYIEAIETCSYEKLPGIPYAIGFIRSYANYLGFDGEEAIQLFKNEANRLPNKHSNIAIQDPLSETSLSKRYIIILGIIIIVACIIVWQKASNLNREAATVIPTIDEYTTDATPNSTINAPSDIADIANVKNVQTITIDDDESESTKTIKVVEIENNSGSMSVISENIEEPKNTAEMNDNAIDIDKETTEAEDIKRIEEETSENNTGNPPIKPEGMSDASFQLAMQIFMVPDKKPTKDKLLQPFKEIPTTNYGAHQTLDSSETSSNIVDLYPPGMPNNNAEKIKIYGMDNIGTRIVITAKDSVSVLIHRGNEEVFAKELNKGDKIFTPIPNGKQVIMSADNAGAIDIIVDDNIHVYPGKAGQAISNFSLNVTDLKNFLENQNTEEAIKTENKTKINSATMPIDRR